MLCTREQASCLISGTGWEWDDGAEWTLDNAQGDAEGWEYAFCFGFGFEWHDTCGMTDCVRRRAWIRRLRKSESSEGDSSPCRVTHLRMPHGITGPMRDRCVPDLCRSQE